MMKRYVLSLLSLLCSWLATAQEVRLTVSNSTDVQRQEVVAFSETDIRSRLGIGSTEPIFVKNALGQMADYQLTHDGLLLVDVSVRPKGKAVLTASRGCTQSPRAQVYGAEYDYRKNDIAWENDRIGFRVYGPQFQSDGDIGNGIDVWVKNSPDLVLPKFYEDNCFKKISFHQDHGYGMDVYGVGPSLGCGAPALMQGDSLLLARCYESYKILDNGPLRFTVQLDFAPVSIGSSRQVTEHRIIRMDKGSHFCQMTVWYDGLRQPLDMATGVVLHGVGETETSNRWLAYADPTQTPDKNQSEIYVATLFPSAPIEIRTLRKPNAKFSISGHLLGIKRNLKDGERVIYYFGAAWSKADIRNFSQWKRCISDELAAIEKPLIGCIVSERPEIMQ